MRKWITRVSAVTGFLIVTLFLSTVSAQDNSLITIGTGDTSGVYYPAGKAICKLVNAERREHGIRCALETTSGSSYNIESLRLGDLDLAIVQSDIQHYAFHGEAPFSGIDPFDGLRYVFSLHAESFTVVARADAGIATFDDISGKRVNIGEPGSGQRATMEMLMAAKGWTLDDFAMASELGPDDQAAALCDNKFDVMIYAVGHPSEAINKVTTLCDSVLVEVGGPVITKLVEDKPYYRFSTIPGGMYRGNLADVATFGVSANLVSTVDTDQDIIFQVVKAVFDNLDEFKGLHPALENLTKEQMIQFGFSTPLHDGAIRYFKEAGLM